MKIKWITSLAVFFVLMLWMVPLRSALADAAPPLYPPGGDVGSGGFETQVQMAAEEVMIKVEHVPGGTGQGRESLTAYNTRAHVNAYFYMVNRGEQVESFDVWFPLGGNDGYGSENTVKNFAAWVGDTPAEVEILTVEPLEWDDPSEWATWPAVFAPGQTTTLHVAYYAYPTGYTPFGEFQYILHTGAGWWGNIGQGRVTVRLPYDVSPFNTVLEDTRLSPQPDYFTLSGNEVVWEFTDLEPAREDDISITVLAPGVWQAILDAEAAVEADLNNPSAHLRLARARVRALTFKHGLEPVGASLDIARLALDSYDRTLELSPDDVDVHVEYLTLLRDMWSGPQALEEAEQAILRVMPEALELAPDDPRLQELLKDFRVLFATATPTPTRTLRATGTPRAGTSTPPPATLTPLPENTLPPTIDYTETPTGEAESGVPANRPGCLSGLILLLPALGLWMALPRRWRFSSGR